MWLLRKSTTFPYPIFKSRIIFGKDFPSRFQILTRNLKFLTFRVCKPWKTVFFRVLIICVRLLRKRSTFPGPIFKSRTIFGKDFPSQFQILTQNLKFSTFRVCKSWKTVFSNELIFCVRLLRKRTTFPGPIFKSRTIFGKDFPSQFQILTRNLNFSCRHLKILAWSCQFQNRSYFWKLDLGRWCTSSITTHKKSTH